MKTRHWTSFICAFLFLLTVAIIGISPIKLLCNDAAVEAAAGGIILKKESRITMEKENLMISLEKITVEYEFRNETDKTVTTDIAFPIPEYEFWGDILPRRDFLDFKVWVEGKPVTCNMQARAFLNGKEYTNVLRKMGITIETFGEKEPPSEEKENSTYQVDHLSQKQKAELEKLGLIDKKFDDWPRWSVQKTYFWTQQFPANAVVRIRHEYAPAVGYKNEIFENLQPEIKEGCIENNLIAQLKKLSKKDFGYINVKWVKYILTTANTWKTPIKHFELIIAKSIVPDFQRQAKFVSLCWDGKIEKLDDNRYITRMENFVPTRELVIYFFK